MYLIPSFIPSDLILPNILSLSIFKFWPEDATAAWDWLFQSEGFLQAYEKDSAKAVEVFEKVVLINAGVASTDAGLHIGQNGMRNREHRFYGEE